MAKIAFLGLGVMGGPMARHLAVAGHDVTVFNRSFDKAEAWVAANGGTFAKSAAAAAEGAAAVLACVGRDGDVEEVTLGQQGAFQAMASGSLFVDHTTVSAKLARRLAAEGAERGLLVVDAPGLGRAGGGRGRHAFDHVRRHARGGRTRASLAGGLCRAHRPCRRGRRGAAGEDGQPDRHRRRDPGHRRGAALHAERGARHRQGVRGDLGGAAGSWQMQNRWASMAADSFDFGFAVDWMRKDLGLALDEARGNGATLPVAALVDQFYAEVQQMGGGRQDTSSIHPAAGAVRRALLLALLLASPAIARKPLPPPPAEVPLAEQGLVDNVNGYTLDERGQLARFSGLLIDRQGKVVRLLHEGDARPQRPDFRLDGQHRTLLPGLIDAHGHVGELGFQALSLDLTGTKSLEDAQRRLAAYAAARTSAKWIRGGGWNQETWKLGRFPTAADLDAVIKDRPVLLERIDGHAVLANSAAMAAAGIGARTPDPAGGRIERDAKGNPTGLFVDAARKLVESAAPPVLPRERDAAIATAQDILLADGVTATCDMGTSIENWESMRRLGDAGRLRVRIVSYALGLEPLLAIAGSGPTPWLYDGRLRMVGVKFYADGALGSRGAWLKAPYADAPGQRGTPFHGDAELKNLMSRAAMDDFQIAVHAIGDAANAQVLDAIEELSDTYKGDRRWRIEHAQIVDVKDLPRFAKFGTIASMQPSHATSDHRMAVARLGPGRLGGAYAWKTMLDEHVPLAFGSDYPVEDPNPFPGMADAVTRADAAGDPPGGFLPEQRITLTQAMAAFTTGAAFAAKAEERIGSLAPGHYADFILVDRDPFQADPQALRETKVLETWIGGVRAWVRK